MAGLSDLYQLSQRMPEIQGSQKDNFPDVVTLGLMKSLGLPQSQDFDMPAFTKAWLRLDPRATISRDPYDGNRVHYTDYGKLPTHPSFSSESIYADKNAPSWKTYKVNDKEYWRLEKPNGEIVSWDAPWAQGPSTSRLNEIKDFTQWGIPSMQRDGLADLMRWR